MFFPSSSHHATTPPVGRISIRHYSTKGSASQLLRFEPTSSQNRLQSGFTLIELLVVIALLALVSGAVLVGYNGVKSQGRADVTKYEMAEIKKALLQFRRDSGSKAFPGQGIYDCDQSWIQAGQENITLANPWPNGSPSFINPLTPTLAEISNWKEWCQHPANFWMLFINPLNDLNTSDEEGGWDQDRHRGWHGPYIQRNGGYLDIGNDLSTAGTGNPYTGNYVDNIWAIASPFIAEPDNGYLLWSNMDSSTANGYQKYDQHGSPYFMFDLDDEDQARLVSMGKDNEYTDLSDPDCKQPLDSEDNPVDYILCLLR